MTETTEAERADRDLAERVLSAYAQQASGALHPQQEQTLLARLAEAAGSFGGTRNHADLVGAINAALDAFETAEPDLRGPRIAAIDRGAGTVTIAQAG